MKFLKQSLLLIASFAVIYAWQNTFMAGYTIYALGILIFVYLVISARTKKFNPLELEGESLSNIFILNTLIFLLIFATGNLTSPLFFLLYFLGFGLVFIFEPATVFIFVIGTILVFLTLILKDDVLGNVIKIGFLSLASPLAFFFGNEFKQEDKETAGKREKKL